MLTSARCRAARRALDWTQGQLAENAKVGYSAVAALETGAGSVSPETKDAIVNCFDSAGVVFVPPDDAPLGYTGTDLSAILSEFNEARGREPATLREMANWWSFARFRRQVEF